MVGAIQSQQSMRVKHLQKLSMKRETVANEAPHLVFKREYGTLFECLHAVFGFMMSNSWLCKKNHDMMRHSLRSGTEMDQGDTHRSFATGISYSLKQERRAMTVESTGPPTKKYRQAKDTKIKCQQEMVGVQLLREVGKFEAETKELLLQENNGILLVSDIKLQGRRV